MAYNSIVFKKSMLAWEAIVKKAQTDMVQEGKEIIAAHPEAAPQVSIWTKQLPAYNKKLQDALDKVINAKDDKARDAAAKTALADVKQYQAFASSAHLPPEISTNLKNGLLSLTKALS